MPDPSTRVEILIVEDNPTDAELCPRSLKNHNLGNDVVWLRGGAPALDCPFWRGRMPGETWTRPSHPHPLSMRAAKTWMAGTRLTKTVEEAVSHLL